MDFKHLFLSFDGRIGRQSWWIGVIILMVINIVVQLIIKMIFGEPVVMGVAGPEMSMAGMIPLIIFGLVMLYPALALYTKRWHDRNKSGWWTAIILIPLVGVIWWFVVQGFLKGTDGANDYGPDPLA